LILLGLPDSGRTLSALLPIDVPLLGPGFPLHALALTAGSLRQRSASRTHYHTA
jgi:hypothetical protein